MPIDTIYIQGIDPSIHTRTLIEEFLRYGPIVAVVRNIHPEEPEKRKYMFIQYEPWAAAWHAVRGCHGKRLRDQDINVEISNRTLDKNKGQENGKGKNKNRTVSLREKIRVHQILELNIKVQVSLKKKTKVHQTLELNIRVLETTVSKQSRLSTT